MSDGVHRHGKGWRFRFREAGRYRSLTFDTKRDALAARSEHRRMEQLGLLGIIEKSNMTFGELVGHYLDSMESRWALATTRINCSLLRIHILPVLEKMTLGELSRSPHILEVLDAQLAAKGLGVSSRQRALNLQRAIFERAVRWQWMVMNPAKRVEMPRSDGTKRRPRPFTPEMIEQLRAFALALPHTDARTSIRDATLISVLAYAGLRPGEALGLSWRHVGPGGILVERSAYHGTIKSTKTGRIRTVKVDEQLVQDLDRWMLASGATPDSLIFASAGGGPWTIEDWRNFHRRVFRAGCLHLGFAVEVVEDRKKRWRGPNGTGNGPRPYDLRHSFVTHRLHEGYNVIETAQMAGHRPDMTLHVYGHVLHEVDPTKDREPISLRALNARRALERPNVNPRVGLQPPAARTL